MKPNAPVWKIYEQQIYNRLRASIARDVSVTFDEEGRQRLPGRFSLIDRQIDVIVRGKFAGLEGEHTMIVDCKCINRRIDVVDVEAFSGLVDDVNAPLGLLVTTEGSSPAAKNRANGVRGLLLDVVALDVLQLWELRQPVISISSGANYATLSYFDGKDLQTRLVEREFAERLLQRRESAS